MIKVSVYTKTINPRIEYALKIVFRVVLGIDFIILTRKEDFINQEGIKINYSEENIDAALQILPHGLLNVTGIQIQNINISTWHDLPVFFHTSTTEIPFDLFSAVFYLITRYEEYLPFKPDKHGRFQASQSISGQGNFLRLPLIDLWCIELAKQLGINEKCPNIHFNNYSFQLTIDVDYSWIYKNKGFTYSLGSILKSVFTLRLNEFRKRILVLTGQQPDPGDSYCYLEKAEKRLGHSLRYFIHCRERDNYYRNRSVGCSAFNKLIHQLDNQKRVGIHPSYASAENVLLLEEEMNYLSGILGRKLDSSRQHYLRIFLPGTYQKLIEHDIFNDYSMGYASDTGFRAGIARSFNFYDLSAEKETRLRVYPFQVMDRTLLSYLNLSPDDAIREFEYYTNTIRSVGGEFICLWHNDSLSDSGEWKGWKRVFENMVEMNEYL